MTQNNSSKTRDRLCRRFGWTAAVAALSLPLSAWAQASAPISGDPVTISGGRLAGVRQDGDVKAYLGVPFAKPPVDDLRWKPPQPMSWNGVWNADHKGAECIQPLRPHNINHYFGEEQSSEDCLYLNLWAPAKANAKAKLPVIVFIYGGGGTIGSSGMPSYDGQAVAERGAVLVNFNYRLGILGFMAHPELTREQDGHSGDYAYLDQVAALRWVHDNIAKFGGDPDKVVIIGVSAGALGVSALMFSPLAKGLFRGAVMASACSFTDNPFARIVPLQEAEQTGLDVQHKLGVANLDAMRQVPADRILALQSETQLGANTPGVRAWPDIDGYFTPMTEAETLKAHAVNDVPIIAGSNEEDLDAESPLGRVRTLAAYHEQAAKMFGADAPRFLALYPASTDEEAHMAALKAAREMSLVASNRTCAKLQTEYNHSPAYLELFTRAHPFTPGVKIADIDPATAGAYHTADIPYWFGTFDSYNLIRHTRDWQPQDRALSAQMIDALIAFARTGNPSTPQFTWPAWSPSKEVTAEFGDGVRTASMDVAGMNWLAAHRPAPVALTHAAGPSN